MSDNEKREQQEAMMQLGEEFRTMVRAYSDVLRGAVTMLIEEGWSDTEAREIALLAWKQAVDSNG